MRLVPAIIFVLVISCPIALQAQPAALSPRTPEQKQSDLLELHQELNALAARIATLEAETMAASEPVDSTSSSALQKPSAPGESTRNQENHSDLSLFSGTTLSFGFDAYYGYNFNAPVGGVNLLRAYDVTSNSFNINQANVVVEHLPTPAARMGGRLDLQFGQATETLQGSSANEQRPQVWRNLFQAYGSYLAPLGSGLRVDFGKWASSLGNEGNYTKDQIAYSRSYSFNFLPFYHMGLRANYNISSKVHLGYWLVNGANDTEDLNGSKSQAVTLNFTPRSTLSWNANYYFGQETRDVQPTLNPGIPTSPTQPGLPTANIAPAPNGREHIFDTYATWNISPKLTLVSEADYVINRSVAEQRPRRVVIGSLTAQYKLLHSSAAGGRFEYFDDRGGLFSGSSQALKEATLVLDHLVTPTFLLRAEYRRDFSNQQFFLTQTPGVLSQSQDTATMGLVYWWGGKQGSW